MKNVQEIAFHDGSKEELLPDFAANFPYITSRVEFDKIIERSVPWHWHRPVELFYIASGALSYNTPGGEIPFPAGSGGLVNANVLHMTKDISRTEKTVQLLHIFDVSLLAGEHGSRIQEKYITPIITDPQIEMIPLFPEQPEQKRILDRIVDIFHLSVVPAS